jgi:hypothetical protein
MAERTRTSVPRSVGTNLTRPAHLAVSSTLDDATLASVLTPRGLFTNLFPIALPSGASVGTIKVAPTDRVKKSAFEDRKQPNFYQAGDRLFAFGPGLDDFVDTRFSRAIIAPETDREFTKFLLKAGLMDLLRARKMPLKRDQSGFSTHVADDVIASSRKANLHIIPQFTFQPYWVETTSGALRFAFAVEVRTTTLSTLQLGPTLRGFSDQLDGVRMVITNPGCSAGCILHGRQGQVLGVFRGFAPAGTKLDCNCHNESFEAIPVRIVDRGRGKVASLRFRHNKTEDRTYVVPGQILSPAPGQRRLLRLSSDKTDLERKGRVWLGDLTNDGRVRAAALQVRYSRIQALLARIGGDATAPIQFRLPTGAQAQLERVPLTVEEVGDV